LILQEANERTPQGFFDNGALILNLRFDQEGIGR
jgi:hypothetical protein